ncbi:Planctomycete cytochrome C [Polystyrenella longa]|uniref:Planctomycete cytochrome C n=1 Tax=Polystyrenella longa TaxID=2528007 RepID=A0A518CKI9_9PLAN|nr:c-type cytochrome domain-containing protein [Polystyrenella longa]QDU79739.1 Planctomycete cytochrome C [Polystyrenella longa]
MNGTHVFRPRLMILLVMLAVSLYSGIGISSSLFAGEKETALRPIRQALLKSSRFAKRKDIAQATQLLDEATQQLEAWKTKYKVAPEDRTYKALLELMEERRADLTDSNEPKGQMPERKNRNSKVSFSRHIIPILQENCFSCHDDQAAGGLQLDTLAGMRKGGKGGRILEPKNPKNSLIMQRLIATGERRMPKDADPLDREQLVVLNDWILQGAEIDQFKVEEEKTESSMEKLQVARPTGNETVSFKKDIAPFFARLCMNCHNDQQSRGGLSMSTFEKLLKGGESGEVLVPGDLDSSRLFRLTGGLELPRMPNNEARLTRKNYEDLKKWIEEGIKYDGDEPSEPLTSLLPDEAELARQRFEKMPEEEFRKHRLDESLQIWKRIGSGNEPTVVETDHFLILGNVPEERLQQAGKWAEQSYSSLQTRFNDSEKPAWKGRLAVFITADRFLHGEFFTYMKKGELENYPAGIVQVTPANATAFVELMDSGDQPTGGTPGMQFQLQHLVTEAFLSRGGVKFPDWFRSGMSQRIVLEDNTIDQKNVWARSLNSRLVGSIKKIAERRSKNGELFTDGFFTPAELDLYGFALVEKLSRYMEPKKLDAVVAAVRAGVDINAAFTQVGVPNMDAIERNLVIELQDRAR